MAEEIFILLGAIILLGFAAQLLFERTRIPDVLILMLFGILIGPLKLAEAFTGGSTVIDVNLFSSMISVVGTVALIIILFEGGFNLSVFKAFAELSTATWFTFLIFSLTTALTALVLSLFGWNFLHGLLVGAIIGGTSSEIVAPILNKSRAGEETKTLLFLESTLTDALSVVAAVIIIGVIAAGAASNGAGVSLNSAANILFGQFSIAAVIAVLAAVAWIKILSRFSEIPFKYMLSVAILFVMYGFVESVRGSGAVSVLAFGLILGNWNDLAKRFNLGSELAFDRTFRSFQAEINFFVRTFIYVYVGIVFNLFALSNDLGVLLQITAVLLALGIARALASRALVAFDPQFSKDRMLVFSMMPRGLAAAVLATLPAIRGISIPFISEIVFLTIILTNIVTATGFGKNEEASDAKEGAPQSKGENGLKPRIIKQV